VVIAIAMKNPMKVLLTLLLAGILTVAQAQVPPGSDAQSADVAADAAASADAGQVLPAEDEVEAPVQAESPEEAVVELDPDEDAQASGEADEVADEVAGEVAGEASGEKPGEEFSDPAAGVEEDATVAASAQDEFNPDEEISEDYPVPLPSDI